jgi:hypothetical protein
MRIQTPTVAGPRKPAVRTKALTFSPEPGVWRVAAGSLLLKQTFETREAARAWMRSRG